MADDRPSRQRGKDSCGGRAEETPDSSESSDDGHEVGEAAEVHPVDFDALAGEAGLEPTPCVSDDEAICDARAGALTLSAPLASDRAPGPGHDGPNGARPKEQAWTHEEVHARGSWLALPPTAHDGCLVRVSNDDLQEAALRGDLGLVRRLIHAGASVNAPMRPECDDEFMTLLHILTLKPEMPNGTRIVAEIIKTQANLNARSSLGATPLICACASKHMGAAEVLLHAKAQTNPVDDFGRNAVCCAALRQKNPRSGTDLVCAELIQALAKSGADLDDGGDAPPIVEAVNQLNGEVVRCLIELGATPQGLSEAVGNAPVELIKELVKAEANPFTKDRHGKTVMDIALARGDEEVNGILRDFIGDLQRQQHQHLKTLAENGMYGDTEDEVFQAQDVAAAISAVGPRKSIMDVISHGKVAPETRLAKQRAKFQKLCRTINRNRAFQVLMFTALLCALFLPDLWVIVNVSNNDILDHLLILILVCFVVEFVVQLIGHYHTYTCSFFFWMDLLGVISVPLDHSVVIDLLPMTFDNAVVMRAARMAKLGARAGRFTKLVKLLRFLPGMQQQGAQAGTAKVISNALNTALSTRVSCLIIIMVMILPIFELFTYPPNDFSMITWLDVVDVTAWEHPNDLEREIDGLERFYVDKNYFPFEMHALFRNSTEFVVVRKAMTPIRERNRIKIKAVSGRSWAIFNFRTPNQIDSLCNCMLIITIIILMMGSSLVLSNSVSAIVLTPLETLLAGVQRMAAKIFNSVATMAGKLNKDDEDKDAFESEAREGNAFGNETQLLERVLKKLSTLSEITVKKSPIDAETLEQLGENDRAVLQGYTVEAPCVLMRPVGEEEVSAMGDVDDVADELIEAIEAYLGEVDLCWDQLENWDFNVLELSDRQRAAAALCFMLFHRGVSGGSTGVDHNTGFAAFVEAAAQGYGHRRAVPYHNWCHGVDVAFAMFRLLNLCVVEHFLGCHERFALVVSAICHDLGHPGLNNPFLVETHHELAVMYNDQSPLENMHCARLFELVSTPACGVFDSFERSQVREIRHVCIEAILHTDNHHHFTMVKEIQMLYEMNCELFETSEDMYNINSMDFPSKEAVDFFRTADVKKALRNVFLHFCDVASSMKPWALCKCWAHLCLEEFFMQGDKEKELGLAIQPLNDRTKVNGPYSQVGFIEFFVAPLMLATNKLMPPIGGCTRTLFDNLNLWVAMWIDTSDPPPDDEEQAKVLERIAKIVSKHHHGG